MPIIGVRPAPTNAYCSLGISKRNNFLKKNFLRSARYLSIFFFSFRACYLSPSGCMSCWLAEIVNKSAWLFVWPITSFSLYNGCLSRSARACAGQAYKQLATSWILLQI